MDNFRGTILIKSNGRMLYKSSFKIIFDCLGFLISEEYLFNNQPCLVRHYEITPDDKSALYAPPQVVAWSGLPI